jgi:peptidoglycan/xylan/chitin deacetylase (PgdA/CDA1 family)
MLTKEIIPILMYHDISNKINNHSVYYKKFFLQINLLNKLGYEAVNLCDLHKKTIKKKFVITFDDGYANIAKYVLPFLKKKNLKATCFIVTNSIGKFNHWDKKKSFKKKKIMSLEQIKSWVSAGLEIGSHTSNHYNLKSLNKNKLKNEIVGPIQYFKKIGIEVKTFSYPFGNYETNSLRIVKKNYQYAVTTNRSRYKLNHFKRNILPRIPINHDTSLIKLFLKISTFYEDMKHERSIKC